MIVFRRGRSGRLLSILEVTAAVGLGVGSGVYIFQEPFKQISEQNAANQAKSTNAPKKTNDDGK